jgi:hypothetical protein
MIKQAMEHIEAISKPQLYEINNRTYTDKRLVNLPDKKIPGTLTVNTLTGFRDYIKSGFDDEALDAGLMVHVQAHNSVSLITELFGIDTHQRITVIEAVTGSILDQGFSFDRFMTIPEFIIGLQANFAHTDDKQKILELVSNIKAEQSQSYLDTGYSQEVTAKRATGSSLSTKIQVPNPVMLKPYRTFLEVDQPESSFVFRLHSGREGEPPQCGLFDASGGAWKLNAIMNINEWLKDQDLGLPIIA